MKIPVIWLNDFVKVDDIKPADLAAKLVSIGFEVEEILYTGDGIEGVVTGGSFRRRSIPTRTS